MGTNLLRTKQKKRAAEEQTKRAAAVVKNSADTKDRDFLDDFIAQISDTKYCFSTHEAQRSSDDGQTSSVDSRSSATNYL